jgi:hypothetical protein
MMDSGISRDPSARAEPTRGSRPDRGEQDVRSLLADLMPWAVTILLHGAMVLIAILIVWATLEKKDDADPLPPPVIRPAVDHGSIKFRSNESLKKSQASARPSPKPPAPERKPEATTIKAPPLWGASGSQADARSAFTPPGGGAVGTGLFTEDSRPGGSKSFAFVIDASGSMIDTLPFVVAELKKTLRTLGPRHSFTVVFYQDDAVIEALTPGLKPASQENIEATMNWLDGDALSPRGLSNPIKAIEHTLRQKPEVMFLLSDNITGSGPWELNQRELLARIKRANTGKTRINSIQFLYPDPLSRVPGMKPTMEMLSQDTGGIYRFHTARELGL